MRKGTSDCFLLHVSEAFGLTNGVSANANHVGSSGSLGSLKTSTALAGAA